LLLRFRSSLDSPVRSSTVLPHRRHDRHPHLFLDIFFLVFLAFSVVIVISILILKYFA
jgi:hypothetical protein